MKSKNMKRTVISTALALTLTAGLTAPAGAAFRAPCPEELKNCLPVSIFCDADWLKDLLGCPNWEKPEVPEVPEAPEAPDAPEAPNVPEAPVIPDTDDSTTDSSVHAYEKAVAELVNAERAKHGLAALKFSAELADGARAKSLDMARNNYFSHTSPTYGSPFDMMKTFGITYKTAGENIAKGYASPEAVVTAWMNSEGHRKNILDSAYTAIGVGYVSDGGYWTQWFTG